ncbi:MAG: hypothetical protein Q9175_006610 [Cornicularia normoerica]
MSAGRPAPTMQASHLDVHQGGSHFGPVEASQSNIFQGNFSGLTINATVAAQIEAGSKESIERDYIQIYRLLCGRPLDAGQETLKVEDAVPAVKHWFRQREGRWLVVLDSADSINDDRDRSYIHLQYFMPDAPDVYIMITSRSATAREITRREAVKVADMESSEAVELFQRCVKMQDPGPDVTMEVGRIVQELGYLALAITLAGSYVSVTPRFSADIRRYLPEYRQRRTELLRRRLQQ